MFKIYGIPISVHTRKVVISALHKGIEFEVVPVVPFIPDTIPANWAALSPTRKIPVVDVGHRTLSDSLVIGQYLDLRQPTPPLYPTEENARLRAFWFEQYCGDVVFREVVQPLFVQTIVRPKILSLPTEQAAIDQVVNEAIPKVFGFLNGELSSDFAAGRELSMGDIAIVSNLTNYRYLGFPLDATAYPTLSRYYQRIAKVPAVAKALQSEQPFVKSMNLDATFLQGLVN